MNDFTIYGNAVEWNNMNYCSKTHDTDDPLNKCDFVLDNYIPECIYKGPNTSVHLCLIKVKDLLDIINDIPNNTLEITDDTIIKTCIIFIFLSNKLKNNDLNKLDDKIQSLRKIEINSIKLNNWKKDNNYNKYNINNNNNKYNINNNKKYNILPRYYINGYISKHGYYKLPISFREIELFSNPIIKKELEKNINNNLLMILEHRKFNSKPYGIWDYSTIGGGLMKNETYEECIIRETYEESGILLDSSDLDTLVQLKLPANNNLNIQNSNTVIVFKTDKYI